jgi:hypothetical protein
LVITSLEVAETVTEMRSKSADLQTR